MARNSRKSDMIKVAFCATVAIVLFETAEHFIVRPIHDPSLQNPVTLDLKIIPTGPADNFLPSPPAIESMDVSDTDELFNLTERFQRRRSAVKSMCDLLKDRRLSRCENNTVRDMQKWVPANNLIFCAIQKIGSTFWLRILKILSEHHKSKNPLDISPRMAYGGSYKTLGKQNRSIVDEILNNSTKIMFVRDPYTRLFSAWLDKTYLTNVYYWSSLGRRIVKSQRPDASNASLNCGHDVTFAEFVGFIVSQVNDRHCIDGHFSPIVSHCQPCQTQYDYIGKYETIKEDTMFILKDLGLSEKVKFNDFKEDSDIDFISDVSSWVFENKKGILKCMSFGDGLFRAWRTLQGRGILSKKATFPYLNSSESQTLNLTAKDFKASIIKAHAAYGVEDRKGNRAEILREAYNSLSEEQRDSIYSVFQRDFELYRYDRYPSYMKSESPDDGFRYIQFARSDKASKGNSHIRQL